MHRTQENAVLTIPDFPNLGKPNGRGPKRKIWGVGVPLLRLHYIGMVDEMFGHPRNPDSSNLLNAKTIPRDTHAWCLSASFSSDDELGWSHFGPIWPRASFIPSF